MSVDDSYTRSLLHFEGADASTTFTDESGKTWTRAGTATISTTQKKFGNSSGLFASGDYIYTANHADFAFGAGDFTIDFWVRATTTRAAVQIIVFKAVNGYTTAPFNIALDANSYACKFYSTESGGSWSICNGVVIGTLTQNIWAHVAVVRSGTNIYTFLNGVPGSTTAVAAKVLLANTDVVRIGHDGTYYPFTGNIDEFRLSKGIARWTSDFSASLPIYPYPNYPTCYLQSRGRSRGSVGSTNAGISTQNIIS